MGCIMFIGTPRGAFTSIPYLYLELPPRVFLGILSEYCTHKYSPELVNKDFGDFLVMLYIWYIHTPLSPACTHWEIQFYFTEHQRQPKNMVKGYPKYFLSLFWLPLGRFLGGVNFCNLMQSWKPLNYFLVQPKKNPSN